MKGARRSCDEFVSARTSTTLFDFLLLDNSRLLITLCELNPAKNVTTKDSTAILSLFSKGPHQVILQLLDDLLAQRCESFKQADKDMVNLLRDNSIVPLLLSSYAKLEGMLYIHRLYSKTLKKFLTMSPKDMDTHVNSTAEEILRTIIKDINFIPHNLNVLCHSIYKNFVRYEDSTMDVSNARITHARSGSLKPKIEPKWKTSITSLFKKDPTLLELQTHHKVISTFFFLRFLIPAVSFPENYGLVDIKITPQMRSHLVRISKYLLLVSNTVDVADESMDELVKRYRPLYYQFVDQFLNPPLDPSPSRTSYVPASNTNSENEKNLKLYMTPFLDALDTLDLDQNAKLHFNTLKNKLKDTSL